MTAPEAWTWWLAPSHGNKVHAFNLDATTPYLEAACKHTVPRGQIEQNPGGKHWCLPCLIAVGEQIPTDRHSHGDAL